jgi:hypothetical protein
MQVYYNMIILGNGTNDSYDMSLQTRWMEWRVGCIHGSKKTKHHKHANVNLDATPTKEP